MKRIFLVLVVLSQVALAGVALANTVTVDFSVLGSDVVDITTPNPGYTLNGITFLYDNFGTTDLPLPSAQVSHNGISGAYNGLLEFNFNNLAQSLNFHFSIDPAASYSVDNGLLISITNDSNDVYISGMSTQSDGTGVFSFTGDAFDQAAIYFPFNGEIFSVNNITYDPVPLPPTMLLLGSGLLGMAGWRRFRKS